MDIVDLTIYNFNDENEILDEIRKYPHKLQIYEKTKERCMLAIKIDGCCLKYVPKSMQTEEMCFEAVKNNGKAIQYVSKKLITYEMSKMAVSNSGTAIRHIPEQLLTKEICLLAIENNYRADKKICDRFLNIEDYEKMIKKNGLLLGAIEEKYRTEALCKEAITQNIEALCFVPEKIKNQEFCKLAFEIDSRAIFSIPECYITKEMFEKAFKDNWKSACYIPQNYLSKELVIEAFECYGKWAIEKYGHNRRKEKSIGRLLCIIPEELQKDKDIISAQRKNGIRWIKSKYFDTKSNSFTVEEYVNVDVDYLEVLQNEPEKYNFHTFAEFYDYVDGQINDADLSNYIFSDEEIIKYKLDGCKIKSDNLIACDLYNRDFFEKNIAICNKLEEKEETNELLNIFHNECFEVELSKTQEMVRKIFYISDIHLNHKLLKQFPQKATEFEAIEFINRYVDMLIASANITEEDYLIVAGDVSSTFCVSEIFYTALANKWNGGRIVAILGNHELWNLDKKLSYEEIVAQYKELFDRLNISFLNNSLYIDRDYESKMLSYDDIIKMDYNKLQYECSKSSFIIFGGLGFSGYNSKFNASNGIYAETIDQYKDLKETQNFEKIYITLKNKLRNHSLIILTHTPMDCWTKEEPVSNWIYVNGHTHINRYVKNDNVTIYADNQIGYSAKTAGLKYFSKLSYYDMFYQLGDGIYKLSRDQYIDFYRGINSCYSIEFNKTDGNILMLKNQGVYCFIFQNDKGRLCILNGGQQKTLKENDLMYYYNSMQLYAHGINTLLKEYNDSLIKISNIVKQIGGDGKIHGSIVDIDYENHLYLNPNDGTVTPYYATNIVNKLVYKDLQTLLKEQKPELLDNYIKLIKGTEKENALVEGCANMLDSLSVYDTDMYSPSLIIKRLQYTTNFNIIREWNDEIIEKIREIVKWIESSQ